MDRFKFRAWDTKRNKILNHVGISQFGHPVESGYQFFNQPTNANNLELMQCTGLKDKHGKLIFESDLWKTGETICVVKFLFCQWMFEYVSGSIQYPSFYSRASEGEIIGNIYENGDLLNNS
jgi:uncharacterized phage protein (TIGR01671 family)